jgi:hypothetical protein
MAADTKTPLQAVVCVICDCLADLSADEQLRALEAARLTLGLRATSQSTMGRTLPRSPLAPVRVEMVNDRPVVVDQPTEDQAPQRGRSLVVVRPGTTVSRQVREVRDAGTSQPLRQLPSPADRTVASRGFVRSLRG